MGLKEKKKACICDHKPGRLWGAPRVHFWFCTDSVTLASAWISLLSVLRILLPTILHRFCSVSSSPLLAASNLLLGGRWRSFNLDNCEDNYIFLCGWAPDISGLAPLSLHASFCGAALACCATSVQSACVHSTVLISQCHKVTPEGTPVTLPGGTVLFSPFTKLALNFTLCENVWMLHSCLWVSLDLQHFPVSLWRHIGCFISCWPENT